jgi:hypothetical protein
MRRDSVCNFPMADGEGCERAKGFGCLRGKSSLSPDSDGPLED